MDRRSRYGLIGKPSAISEAWLAFEEVRLPYQALNRQIWQQEAAIRGTEWWRARESLLSFPQPVPRNWNVDSDPNVPTEFKRTYKSLLQANSKHRKKVVAIWSFIAHKNPKALIAPLRAANSPEPALYSIRVNAICQYLKLAEEHYRLGLGPVTKGELWNEVCKLHVAIFKSRRPTHRALILREIGLGSLREEPPGRPRK